MNAMHVTRHNKYMESHTLRESFPGAETAAQSAGLGLGGLDQVRPHLGGDGSGGVGRTARVLLDGSLLGLDAVLLGGKRDGDSSVLLDNTHVGSPVGEAAVLVRVFTSPAFDATGESA